MASAQNETRLTDQPVTGSAFVDPRIAWGAERCYTVRAVHSLGALVVESEPAPPACEKLIDTFPPAPPKGLVAVASEGAINLIWDANAETDLAGYLVLRAPASSRGIHAGDARARARHDVHRQGAGRHPVRLRDPGCRRERQPQRFVR